MRRKSHAGVRSLAAAADGGVACGGCTASENVIITTGSVRALYAVLKSIGWIAADGTWIYSTGRIYEKRLEEGCFFAYRAAHMKDNDLRVRRGKERLPKKSEFFRKTA